MPKFAVDGTLPGGDSPTLTYLVPPDCGPGLQRGSLVWVPLRKKAALGWSSMCMTARRIRCAADLRVAPGDGLSDDQIEFGLWLQRETGSSLFGCLSMMLPPGVTHSVTPWFELKSRAPGKTKMQERVLGSLGRNGAMSLDQLQQAMGSPLSTVLADLRANRPGIAPVPVREPHRAAANRALVDCREQCRFSRNDRTPARAVRLGGKGRAGWHSGQ